MRLIVTLSILILTFIPAIAIAERPHYNFSDSVFEDLPPFPDDFYQVKHLFDTQKILASQLSEDYYQPELLPTWNTICDRIYSSNKTYSYNGVFIYPSRFDIYNAKTNDTIILSALVYAHPGTSTYQGTQLYLVYNNKTVTAHLLTNNIYILSPTYPKFIPGWMQLVEIKITILDDTKNTTVQVKERDPPPEINDRYRQIYGSDSYSQCTSLLSEKISRCTIYIHGTPVNAQQITYNPYYPHIIHALLFLTLILLLIVYVIWRRKRKGQ